ncbi:MAG: hypothetical protein R3B13_20675 [Polyangiaceae bacterium]
MDGRCACPTTPRFHNVSAVQSVEGADYAVQAQVHRALISENQAALFSNVPVVN